MDITADELINMFDMSIEKIGTKEGICKFLDILARNPELDFMDAVNIYTQYPDGKMLNTYRGWDKEYGRHIKRWEKGIKSIEYIEEELIDDDGEIYDIRSVPKVINKYDISQTQGKAVEKFTKERNIRNKKCQGEFKSLLNGIVKELQKEMGLPLNSFSGICSKYVLLKYYGVPDREFDKHIEGYLFQQTESVSYFLGELFEVLDKTCDKLKNGYAQVISSLIAMEPGIESEEMVIDESPKRVLESKKQSEKLEKSIEKPILTTERDLPEGSDGSDTSASVLITQPIRKATTKKVAATIKKESVTPVVPPKSSLLKRLHIKVKEAKIYNSEKNM